MHELPVTESILKVVLRHAQANDVRRIATIHLRVGKLSDLEDEWIQHYFDYLSEGTVAHGAKLKIERTPIVLRCRACGEDFEADAPKLEEAACPACGVSDWELISGREYFIKEMEVE